MVSLKQPHKFYLLTQDAPEESRFTSFEFVEDCLECILQRFEQYVSRRAGPDDLVTYTCNELFDFVDKLPGLVILEYDSEARVYKPRSGDWLHSQLYVFLQCRLTPVA